jgi:hypothetical protein
MGTEVVGTLTHAGEPQRGNAPHSVPHPACVYHALQYHIQKLCFAGATHAGIRVREQIRVTLKTP